MEKMNEESIEEYIKKHNEKVASMTLRDAIEVVSHTCAHSDMTNEFEKAVQMLIDCAEKESGRVEV